MSPSTRDKPPRESSPRGRPAARNARKDAPAAALPVTDLGTRIRAAVAAIPRGRVCSYGQVAQRAGAPGRARAVGRALGEAPASMKLPWHRVLRASGQIALPKGSPGYEEQVRRLTREGVRVSNGRVDLVAFGFEESLDRELWGIGPA